MFNLFTEELIIDTFTVPIERPTGNYFQWSKRRGIELYSFFLYKQIYYVKK